MSAGDPRVSIGFAVYNGEHHIAQALDAFLAQTFGDFELIVCDNASDDRTEEICRTYAGRDRRIRYVRHARNLGAVRNFNGAFQLARAPYFRWAAADDLNAPESLARCVEVLDREPQGVLAYPKTRFIDDTGRVLANYDDRLHLQAPRARDRYFQLMRNLERCNAVFGLMRSDVMRRTHLFGRFVGSDIVFLAELSLYGTFWEIPEYLFFRRFHDAAASAMDIGRLRTHYEPDNPRRLAAREWSHLWGHARAAWRAPIPAGDKARVLAYLLRRAVGDRDTLVKEAIAVLRNQPTP